MRSIVFLSLLLFGCTRHTTSPERLFCDVASAVEERSNEEISWEAGELCTNDPLTIDDAVRATLIQNPALKAEYKKLGVAECDLAQSTLLRNPLFGFSLKYNNPGTIFDLSLAFDFIDLLLKNTKIHIACKEWERARLSAVEATLEAIGRTKRAYIDLLVEKKVLEKMEEEHLLRQALFLAAKKFFEAKNTTLLFVNETKGACFEQQRALIEQQREVLKREEELMQALGTWSLPSISLELLPPPEISLNAIEDEVIVKNLALEKLRHLIKKGALEAGIAQIEQAFPEVWGGVDAEREGGIWYTGPGMSFPIPLFDTGYVQKKRALFELCRLKDDYVAKETTIRAKSKILLATLSNLANEERLIHEALLPARKETLHAAHLQYNAMQVGIFFLLEKKSEEIQTEIQRFRILQERWNAWLDLELLVRGVS